MNGRGPDCGEAPVLLVLRHHGLGDLVTVQPALKGLRRHFPEHRMVVTCPSWHLSLGRFLGGGESFVTEGRGDADPSRHQTIDEAMLARVRRRVPRADVLVSLRTPGPELPPLVAALRPRRLISYRYAALPATLTTPELDFADHILVRWEKLLGGADIALDRRDIHPRRLPSGGEAGQTIVHCGAGSVARQWPAARWMALLRRLRQAGHRIFLTGSAAEAEMVEQIHAGAGLARASLCAGPHSSLALAKMVARARLVVSVDTGVAHLATAFRRPAVTLFGPIPPTGWGPPPDNPQHRCIWKGRHGDPYGTVPDPGLLEIGVEDVLGEIAVLEAVAT